MKKIRRSVDVIVINPDDHNKVLTVTNRRNGGFSCPGGRCEPGEDAETAAYRELLEETGLRAEALVPIFTAPVVEREDTVWLCTSFVADVGDQKPRNVEEGTVFSWTDMDDVITESLYPEFYGKYMELL